MANATCKSNLDNYECTVEPKHSIKTNHELFCESGRLGK